RKVDLEIIEPIDFSSGDHQHLARKAADKDDQQSSQPYRSSHTAGPGETKENPHVKATKQGNSYVVQITEEITPNESRENATGPFSDRLIRRAFIVKVFLILSVQLLVTAAIITFFCVLIILACCGNLCRQVPANYILLAFFTLLEALLLGTVSVFYKAEEVLWATAATTLVTSALTLFALQTKWDFTLLNGVLFVFVFVLMIYGFMIIFVRSYWLHLIYSALGTVLFSLYLVMDVQLMVGGSHHHYNLDPEEYVFAALNIYLDIINLFIFILQLIGLGR
uniref:Uncharacterized protein n=1 Tax=Castor canadensis TaxID=51338 RepID=A0A8C0XWX0_CASCN